MVRRARSLSDISREQAVSDPSVKSFSQRGTVVKSGGKVVSSGTTTTQTKIEPLPKSKSGRRAFDPGVLQATKTKVETRTVAVDLKGKQTVVSDSSTGPAQVTRAIKKPSELVEEPREVKGSVRIVDTPTTTSSVDSSPLVAVPIRNREDLQAASRAGLTLQQDTAGTFVKVQQSRLKQEPKLESTDPLVISKFESDRFGPGGLNPVGLGTLLLGSATKIRSEAVGGTEREKKIAEVKAFPLEVAGGFIRPVEEFAFATGLAKEPENREILGRNAGLTGTTKQGAGLGEILFYVVPGARGAKGIAAETSTFVRIGRPTAAEAALAAKQGDTLVSLRDVFKLPSSKVEGVSAELKTGELTIGNQKIAKTISTTEGKVTVDTFRTNFAAGVEDLTGVSTGIKPSTFSVEAKTLSKTADDVTVGRRITQVTDDAGKVRRSDELFEVKPFQDDFQFSAVTKTADKEVTESVGFIRSRPLGSEEIAFTTRGGGAEIIQAAPSELSTTVAGGADISKTGLRNLRGAQTLRREEAFVQDEFGIFQEKATAFTRVKTGRELELRGEQAGVDFGAGVEDVFKAQPIKQEFVITKAQTSGRKSSTGTLEGIFGKQPSQTKQLTRTDDFLDVPSPSASTIKLEQPKTTTARPKTRESPFNIGEVVFTGTESKIGLSARTFVAGIGATSISTKSLSKTLGESRTTPIFKPGQKTASNIRQSPIQIPTIKQDTSTKIRQKQLQSLGLKQVQQSKLSPGLSPGGFFRAPKLPPIIPPVSIPGFGVGDGRRSTRFRSGKRPFRFTPTLSAAFFDVTGPKPKQKVFSGFEIRPIISRKKRKKR